MVDETRQTIGQQIKDIVDVTIRLPVLSRLKKRVKEIQELSKAKIIKVPMGNTHKFETTKPQLFITNLQATMQGGVGVISYQTYKQDSKGDKAMRHTTVDKTNAEGNKVKVVLDTTYIIDKLIVERIEHLKKMTTEVMDNE